jgi:hypothetical protein
LTVIFIKQLSNPFVYDEVVQNLDAKLELISTGFTGCFIESYAGIDLHSSNNYFDISTMKPSAKLRS